MRFLLFIFFGLAWIVLGWLAYQNRGSEKLIVGVGGAFLAILAAVFVVGKSDVSTVDFPAAYVIDRSNSLPDMETMIVRQTGMPWVDAIDELHKRKPALFGSYPADSKSALVYHQFLQYEIIEWLGTFYARSWTVQPYHFGGGFNLSEEYRPAPKPDKGDTFSADEVKRKLSPNPFSPFLTNVVPDRSYSLTTPPNTELWIHSPHNGQDEGVIRLSVGRLPVFGPLCKIVIRTHLWAAGTQLDRYKNLLVFPGAEQHKQVLVWLYMVRISLDTDPYRSGNPDLPALVAWARQLRNELQYQLDEELIFKRAEQRGPPAKW